MHTNLKRLKVVYNDKLMGITGYEDRQAFVQFMENVMADAQVKMEAWRPSVAPAAAAPVTEVAEEPKPGEETVE